MGRPLRAPGFGPTPADPSRAAAGTTSSSSTRPSAPTGSTRSRSTTRSSRARCSRPTTSPRPKASKTASCASSPLRSHGRAVGLALTLLPRADRLRAHVERRIEHRLRELHSSSDDVPSTRHYPSPLSCQHSRELSKHVLIGGRSEASLPSVDASHPRPYFLPPCRASGPRAVRVAGRSSRCGKRERPPWARRWR
jgi:hypothetical protein